MTMLFKEYILYTKAERRKEEKKGVRDRGREERKKKEKVEVCFLSLFPHLINGFIHTHSQYTETASLVEGDIIMIIFY